MGFGKLINGIWVLCVIEMSGEHVGLRLDIRKCIHSILLDSGQKYERYIAIGYLPRRGNLNDCVVIGSLEVSKEVEGKEYFNPCKFYDPNKLFDAIIHMIASYVAFAAKRRGIPARQMFFSLLNTVAMDFKLREKILHLSEAYHKKMEEIERGGD
jgi:hypothetical protein